MHANRPALAVRCASAADVVEVVSLARQEVMATAVLGGGYSVDGLSAVQGGLLIDLTPMGEVQIDAEKRLGHVQGGALWGTFDREAQAVGLAVAGARVSEVGVTGSMLAGGHGWLSRSFGLACDSLVEAEVVCADAQVRTASAESHPDLFWAIRGGGANFGIVTRSTFRLHAVGPTVAFALTFYPLAEIADVLAGWRAYVDEAPDEVTSLCAATSLPNDPNVPEAVRGVPVAIVAGVYAADADGGMSVLEPLRGLGKPLTDMSQPTSYIAVQTVFDYLFPRARYQVHCESQYLDTLDDATIASVAAKAHDRPSPQTVVNVLHLGGAIANTAEDETAFASRSAQFEISVVGMWPEPARNADGIAWVRSATRELRGLGAAGERQATRFGSNLERLAEVKTIYDPTNFFCMNRNVAPAVST